MSERAFIEAVHGEDRATTVTQHNHARATYLALVDDDPPDTAH